MILHYEVRLVMSNSTWDRSLDHHACDVMFVWLGGGRARSGPAGD